MLQKATPVFTRLVLMELFILSTSRKKINNLNNLKRLEDLVSEQAQRLERLEQENRCLQKTLHQVRQELRLAEEVFAGSVEGTVITDADFRILRVNRAFTEITGYLPEDVVGNTLCCLLDKYFAREVFISLDDQDH